MLDPFRTFLAVAAAGSFSHVAAADGLAVSSVTRRIDLLEAELKVTLFRRSSRRLTLTDAGERLLPWARRIVDDLGDLRDDLAGLDTGPRGVLTVTAPAAFGRRHIAPALAGFLQRYPEVEIDLHLGDALVDLVVRRVDVAIRIGSLPDSDLIATTLAPVRRLVCASPAYLERMGMPERPADLTAHNCLTLSTPRPPKGWWSFPQIDGGAPLPVRGTLRSDDTGALLEAALAGLGVVHLASWLVGDAIAAGRLVRLFPDLPLAPETQAAIHAVRLPTRSDTAKARLFIAHLRKSFGSPPHWDR